MHWLAYTNGSLSQNINFGQNQSAFPILFSHFSTNLPGWPTKQLVISLGRNCWKWFFFDFLSRSRGFPPIFKIWGFSGNPQVREKNQKFHFQHRVYRPDEKPWKTLKSEKRQKKLEKPWKLANFSQNLEKKLEFEEKLNDLLWKIYIIFAYLTF